MTIIYEENNSETKDSFNKAVEKELTTKVLQPIRLSIKSQKIILKMDLVPRDLLFTVKIKKNLKDTVMNDWII